MATATNAFRDRKLLLLAALLGACSEAHPAWEEDSSVVARSADANDTRAPAPEPDLRHADAAAPPPAAGPDSSFEAADAGDSCTSLYDDSYWGSILSRDWPATPVPGVACSQRTVVPCQGPAGLHGEVEGIATRCRFVASYDPLKVRSEAGCVTELTFGPRSRANEPEVKRCLLDEFGRVRFECSKGTTCEVLYGDTLARSSGWPRAAPPRPYRRRCAW
jgi:hypothetical protein